MDTSNKEESNDQELAIISDTGHRNFSVTQSDNNEVEVITEPKSNGVHDQEVTIISDTNHGNFSVTQSDNKEVEVLSEPKGNVIHDQEVAIISDTGHSNFSVTQSGNNEMEDITEPRSSEIQIISEFSTTGKKTSLPETVTKSSVGSKSLNQTTNYRCESDSWSEDESDSSSSSDTSSDSDFFQMIIENSAPKKLPEVKTKGELGLEDLPPIEDLTITVPEEEMMLIGKIHAVVDKLVVVHALKDLKALDLDSVLFLSSNKPLGRVFDVFGPVVQPFYCVRFNSVDHINEKGIEVGGDVFFAPEKSDITSYVFVDELQKQKGSDASWKNNNEPPEEFLDFSDDEQEKAAKRKRMNKNRNRQFSNSSDVETKKPNLTGESNFRTPVYKNPVPPRSTAQQISMFRRNPFSSLPPQSPSPSICGVMPIPGRGQNPFANPNQPRTHFHHPHRQFMPQNVLQRPPPPPTSPLLIPSPYPSPHVFGQVTLFSPMSPMPPPSPLPFQPNIPTLIPAPVNPENFHQRFTRSPNSQPNFSMINSQRFPRNFNVNQGNRTLPDPWLPNHSPNSVQVPPNYPLTVQIPNANAPPLPVNQFQTGQPFVFNGNNQQNFFHM